MKLYLDEVQNLLATQDYLTFDRVLTSMYKEVDEKKTIEIFDKTEAVVSTLTSFEEVEVWKKRMVQIYGLFGLI